MELMINVQESRPQGVTAPQGLNVENHNTGNINMTSLSNNTQSIEVLEEISTIAVQGEAIALCVSCANIDDLDSRMIEKVLWDLQHKFERISKL
ncbi:hypothetical protein RZS08_09860, partial [Arthrospira platensis SPKY1]|nr:hypothetical protein [Arthrospira platensis SPKY1]